MSYWFFLSLLFLHEELILFGERQFPFCSNYGDDSLHFENPVKGSGCEHESIYFFSKVVAAGEPIRRLSFRKCDSLLAVPSLISETGKKDNL